MSDSLTVGLQYRKNPLSLTDGGVVVSIERGDGFRLDYPNIKYPQAYVRKVVANQLGLDLDEVHQLAYMPEYHDEIKKVVRRIWIDDELLWEQTDQDIPWLERRNDRLPSQRITAAQRRTALAAVMSDL